MSTDTDLIKLYSAQILALGADMPRTARLKEPDSTVRKRSPLCGSTVTVDIVLKDGAITDYGQDVKACALGQAAASVIGSVVVGLTPEHIQRGRDQLAAMLKEGGPVPTAPFEGLKVLEPARDYKNRHASILLTFDAILEAIATAQRP
ncbi:MAG: iron-sulfur cluster assembly scaffold protein [Rhodobacteraceae bacterium]|jgi:NifU-like protein involved in Fe-S cluster formation|nr:iron-sulfur cluster assembly scaffold protein [Paracoccaceae bacterium]